MDEVTAAVVWLRRDLRLADHPALVAACAEADRVAVVFCLDQQLLHSRSASPRRIGFMLECLHAVDMGLRSRGGRLIVRRGDPVVEVMAVARDCGAAVVHFTADVSPYALRRDKRLVATCEAEGIRAVAYPGLSTVDDVGAVRTVNGGPYSMFTPFYRRWAEAPRRAVVAAPDAVRLPDGLDVGRLPSSGRHGGEPAGHELLHKFVTGRADGSSSRLSPYLRFGALSPLLVEASVADEAFSRQLCWRDFFQHVLLHHPESLKLELQVGRRGLPWRRSAADLACWREGRTGYPLVDAAMRQLAMEGWIPNRARLVAGSFLTKHLGIDWREGERWFMRQLLDGDPAQNTGNWQWIASVGTDRQPVVRRLLNPTLQQQRFDPEGDYVRRWVPELANVPNGFLPQPWLMPIDLQAECGCVVGVDYPQPIVEHATARRAALARYAAAAAP